MELNDLEFVIEICCAIKFCNRFGKTTSDIINERNLQNEMFCESTIFRWETNFKKGSVELSSKPSSPESVMND